MPPYAIIPTGRKSSNGWNNRLGRSKAIVAIARRLLVAVWHILTNESADRHADETSVAASMFKLAYEIKVSNLPKGTSARPLPASSWIGWALDRTWRFFPGAAIRSSCRPAN